MISILVLWACQSKPQTEVKQGVDIVKIALELHLEEGVAVATIDFEPTETLMLHVEGLEVQRVLSNQEEIPFTVEDALLWIESPVSPLDIHYGFVDYGLYDFVGWMSGQGVSFTWPYHCGYLFPCHPDPSDGVQFSAIVESDVNNILVYPTEITFDAPTYMFAIAQGNYAYLNLGTSDNGVKLGAYYYPEDDGITDATLGTQHLLASLNDMEQRIGAYAYGDEIASVEVNWGADSYGGMEHHPYFHVGQYDFWNEETQTHELIDGWFGNAIRLECWEDFVLSEGVTTYLTARVLNDVADYDVWSYYVDDFLTPICQGDNINTVVMPSGCDDIDFENSELWSLATYIKGACFFGEVGEVLFEDELDGHLSTFYERYKGEAKTMDDLLQHITLTATPEQRVEIDLLQQEWLQQVDCPIDYATRCRF